MKTVKHKSTYLYYDGPQLFEAVDPIGGSYIAFRVDDGVGDEQFVVAGISPERLRLFKIGEIDLRSLLVERAVDDWYLASPSGGIDDDLVLTQQHVPLVNTEFLPDPGVIIGHLQTADDTLKESISRNNLVWQVTVNPPESARAHAIRMHSLATLLIRIQVLAKYAYSVALRDVSDATRKALADRRNAHVFNVVVLAAAGSYRLIMEPASAGGMWGENEACRALAIIDELFEHTNDLDRMQELLSKYRGHLAGAYKRLLELLIEIDSPFDYAWAQPEFQRSRTHSITKQQAIPLVSFLSRESHLTEESVTLVGSCTKADETRGQWRLATATGEYSGETHKNARRTLNGVVIGNTYRFECVEKITEGAGGRERRSIYLVDYD